jgi:hypothetical protein
MLWIGMAYGAALHHRYVGPVCIDLHLMVITDEEEWNTGPAHRGLAMEIGGDDRVAAGSAYFCYFGNRSSADTSTADGKSRPSVSAAGPGRAWCAGV